jgi:PEP-CTERM motif
VRTRNGAKPPVALLAAMLALCASATEAAPISWEISVFNLTGFLSGNTYSGTVTVDDAYVFSGAQLLTPSNSDLRIVFDFVDDDGVTPRRFTEADDIDYPAFPLFSLQDGVPVPQPTRPPEPPKGPLSFVYFNENFEELWEFGSFTYHFNGGGTGEVSITPTDAAPVPEPATLALVGIGLGLGTQAYRRRKTRDRSRA